MLQESVAKLSDCLRQLVREKIDLAEKPDQRAFLTDFDKRKQRTLIQSFQKALAEVRKDSLRLPNDNPDTLPRNRILEVISSLDTKDKNVLQKKVDELLQLAKQLPSRPSLEKETGFSVRLPKKLPEEIGSEIAADIKELELCYSNSCYRSCIILCGRLLETALHRKYFEVTNFDILEKNPGIGLGNLVAKLAEKNVSLDPGLTQQIHLINQVRIFSVHKKKESFTPSREQTLAIILYTMDVLNRLF